MWNPFRRKSNKRKVRELQRLSTAFAILGEFERRGLTYWKTSDNILLIEESLAVIQMAQGADGFRNFLEQLVAYQSYKIMCDHYEQLRIDAETKAVREAQAKPGVVVTKADIQRIRQHARESLSMVPAEKMNVVREFDIMIIRSSATTAQEATEANGQLLAVGHYDGKTLEMAMYDDIKNELQTDDNEKD